MDKNLFLVMFVSCLAYTGISQDIIKKWNVDPFQIELLRIEQAHPTSVYLNSLPRTFFTMFEIKKNNSPITIGGGIEVSTDSCVLSFLELPEKREKNGIVGNDHKVNLCNKKISSVKVVKPEWKIELIDSITIAPLDSIIYNHNNPWEPFVIPNYNNGNAVKLHYKMIEGFVLFFNDSYLTAKYFESQFQKPYLPTFELTIYFKTKIEKVYYYWGRFITDGFIYGGGSSNIPYELNFWNSNLKLLQK